MANHPLHVATRLADKQHLENTALNTQPAKDKRRKPSRPRKRSKTAKDVDHPVFPGPKQ
jgi:hypothetical protein